MDSFPGALIAALSGAAVAYVNYRITKRAAEKAGSGGTMTTAPLLRMLLSAGLLAAVYFIGPLTPWDRVWLLAGAAVGLTRRRRRAGPPLWGAGSWAEAVAWRRSAPQLRPTPLASPRVRLPHRLRRKNPPTP